MFLNQKATTRLDNPIQIALQSVIIVVPISTQAAKIITTDATFTASKKTANILEFLILFTKGFSKATNKNEGKKTPTVARKAPVQSLI